MIALFSINTSAGGRAAVAHFHGFSAAALREWGYILQAATLAVVTLLGAVILRSVHLVRVRPSPRSATLFSR